MNAAAARLRTSETQTFAVDAHMPFDIRISCDIIDRYLPVSPYTAFKMPIGR